MQPTKRSMVQPNKTIISFPYVKVTKDTIIFVILFDEWLCMRQSIVYNSLLTRQLTQYCGHLTRQLTRYCGHLTRQLTRYCGHLTGLTRSRSLRSWEASFFPLSPMKPDGTAFFPRMPMNPVARRTATFRS